MGGKKQTSSNSTHGSSKKSANPFSSSSKNSGNLFHGTSKTSSNLFKKSGSIETYLIIGLVVCILFGGLFFMFKNRGGGSSGTTETITKTIANNPELIAELA